MQQLIAVAALHFSKTVLIQSCIIFRRNRGKKANEINTHESSSCLKLKFVSNIL